MVRKHIVVWWDARGNARQSEKMERAAAEAFAARMLPEQEAHLILVSA
ncbi:hypothetical protein [Achromobacter pestifer]|uniref:Uncharacterized protein n=1 Tax=Achromobacter pestifer TaxID=1353889 RepID=A0A6S6YI46_9BURK|nr:hypothetical protein [Achromobacter pestifer]CAB3624509.1 hypothetical protein LMG3431_00027 [Achromobacter pestifer]